MMLSREIDEAIMLLRTENMSQLGNDIEFMRKLSDLLLVCAANGEILQAVAETVARQVITSNKGVTGQIELRNV